jgi:hypothetical protein
MTSLGNLNPVMGSCAARLLPGRALFDWYFAAKAK